VGVGHDRATVITVSDGVAAGWREDSSGDGLESMLVERGFTVSRKVVPDESNLIAAAIVEASRSDALVLTSGGTGFGPRDVTPEATASVLAREAPGLVHAMIADGLSHTPMAALGRGRAGTVGNALVVNLPGSPAGAIESLGAIIELIPHALRLLSGDTAHH
jgi:molybdopterin adenylyltransferase